jgi:hypothetical protein
MFTNEFRTRMTFYSLKELAHIRSKLRLLSTLISAKKKLGEICHEIILKINNIFKWP